MSSCPTQKAGGLFQARPLFGFREQRISKIGFALSTPVMSA
jgi:hypothetical protein